jgi:hypothetical protein
MARREQAYHYGAKPRCEERADASPEGGTEPDDIPFEG